MGRRKRKREELRGGEAAHGTAGPAGSRRVTAAGVGLLLLPLGLGALHAAGLLLPGEGVLAGVTAPLVMLWLALLAADRILSWDSHPLGTRLAPLDFPLAALVGWAVLSGLLMAEVGNPRHTLNATWQWLALGAAYLLTRRTAASPETGRALAALLVAAAAGLSAAGLLQYGVLHPQMVSQYREASEEERRAMLEAAGIEAPAGSPQRKRWEARLESPEPTATFALTNSLAGFLAPWLVVLVGIGLQGVPPRSEEVPGSWRGILLRLGPPVGLFVLIALALLLTKSRAAALATLVGLAVLACWELGRRPFRRRTLGLLAAAAGGAALLAGLGMLLFRLDRELFTLARRSLQFRLEYWQATTRLIADHPLFGCGPGNFQEYYPAYKLPQASETIADPHNFLFETAATAGIPALLALLALLAVWLFTLLRPERPNPNGQPAHSEPPAPGALSWRSPAVLVGLGGAAGLLLAGPLGFLTGHPPVFALLLLAGPVAAIAYALLAGWIARGRLSPAALAAGGITLLVNLLAAGGIGYLSIAGSLVLLLALAANLGAQRGPAHESVSPPTPRRLPQLAQMLAALLLLVACHATLYSPVVRGRALLEQGDAAVAQGLLRQAENEYRAAAEFDRHNPEPWLRLAHLQLRRPLTPAQLAGRPLDAPLAEFLARNRRAYTARLQAGHAHLQLWRRTSLPHELNQALIHFRAATELYPHGSLLHAQLAWTLHLAGDPEAAAQSAREALRLDALNPHDDQKLAADRLFDPGPAAPELKQPAPPGRGNAEVIARRLAGPG